MLSNCHEVWITNISPLVEYVYLDFENLRSNSCQRNFKNFFDTTLEDDEDIDCCLEEFICDDCHITPEMMRILERNGLR